MNETAPGARPDGAPADVLSQHAAAAPAAVAVVEDRPAGERRLSFAGLESAANRLAHGLRSLGATPGDRLVWCGPNSTEVLVTTHAARKLGLVAVPLSYRFGVDEMRHVLDDSGASLVVTDAEQAESVAAARPSGVREVVVHGGEAPPGTTAWTTVVEAAPDTPTVPPGDFAATMIYTSGTTGRPKGAMRSGTDRILVAQMLATLGLGRGDDVHLTTGPLYHSGPLAFAHLNHSIGRPVIVTRHFEPRRWLELVERHRVTNTFSAPTQLKRIVALPDAELARADLSSMRCLIADAAPVPYALKQEVIAKLGDGFLYEVYGSTELGVTTILEPGDQLRKPGSCGRPYGSIEVKIVAEDGHEAPTGEPGELFIRTGLAMDGYHGAAGELAGHGAAEEGWRSVGDVAFVDEEGFVSICDRRSDMIISGGVNIYPAEIEAVLHEHPGVLDVAVFGVPDDEWGERVHAVVQPKPDVALDPAELEILARRRLAGYKCPRGFELRAELPRTDSGKLLKRTLRDEHWRDRDRSV